VVDTNQADKLARDLARLLTNLAGLYAELGMHMRDKLEAIKRAEAERVTSIVARETVLADKVAEREGLRRQITRRLAGIMGIPVPADRPLRLSELAEHLGEPHRSRLLSAATGLRQRLAEIQGLQHTTRLVTEEMLRHIGAVVSAMTTALPDGETYERTGVQPRTRSPHIFEAVG